MSEAEFQNQVMHVAKLYGWRIQHARPAQYASGRWATPIQGDAGFVDLVLAHPKHGTIFAELKTDKGKLSPTQVEWIHTLAEAGEEVHVWRPIHFDLIVKRLSGLSWAALIDLGVTA